jgi:hypothetical protein
VILLAVKALLAPGFVVGASVAGRRFGVRVSGLIGGLPVVAGPILLVYALSHGYTFAANAANGSLLGLVSLTVFVVTYSRLATRLPWAVSLCVGWLGFALATAAFTAFTLPAGLALVLGYAALALGLTVLGSPREGPPRDVVLPAWDLPLRAACALALVLILTAIAGELGPKLSGLLAPFPVVASVLTTFTHVQRGPEELLRLARGLISGFGAFALFCFTLAISLPALHTALGFSLATLVALLTQVLVGCWLRVRHARVAS